ncbi:NAD(P)H-binding protein [Chloroflexi bacterium TSY]|nr:NAD(P)H-binding protein [Chloroflexi bacterium TSY]
MQNSNEKTNQKDITLILGGTGKTGRRIVERLIAKDVPTRIGSRSGTPPFDWDDQDTWEPALKSVRAAYVTYQPDLAVPAAPPAIEAFSALAVEKGVERLVLLSGRGEEEAQRCEQIVQNAGVDWTILRASWFNQNFSEGPFHELARSGLVTLPAGPVGEPFINVDDIADIAVAALTEDGHAGQLYEITGPRLMTFTDAVNEIAEASGRDIRYQQIPAEVFTNALMEQGVPTDEIEMLNYLFTTVLDGRNEYLTDGVQRALGRPPRDFRDYARATAASGAWQ